MPFLLTMPKLSPTMTEGTIARWLKKEGEHVAEGEALVEITSDKSTLEYNAVDEGWLRKIIVPEGSNAAINEPLAIFSENQEESIEGFLEKESTAKAPSPIVETKPLPREAKAFPVSEERTRSEGERLFVSPYARKLAEEQGIDLTTIQGSGPRGRIVARDLEHPKAEEIISGEYDEITLSPMRKAIAKRLQEAKRSIPHFYLKRRINADPMVAFRAQLETTGQKVTFNDLIIRSTALALRKHPEVNSGFNSRKETLLRFKTVDIAVAVTIQEGLITPILRNADQKNLHELSLEMNELKEKAKNGKLQEHEYRGGSFTISNLGMYKVSEFLAVINPPHAAILAVGAIEEEARIKEGKVVAGKAMTLTLSCDHRVIDGAIGADFLNTLATFLENPAGLVT